MAGLAERFAVHAHDRAPTPPTLLAELRIGDDIKQSSTMHKLQRKRPLLVQCTAVNARACGTVPKRPRMADVGLVPFAQRTHGSLVGRPVLAAPHARRQYGGARGQIFPPQHEQPEDVVMSISNSFLDIGLGAAAVTGSPAQRAHAAFVAQSIVRGNSHGRTVGRSASYVRA